jgi:starch synthase
MRILYLASEMAPFVKTGGLADVSGAFPHVMAKRGHHVVVVLPLYRSVESQKHRIEPTGLCANFVIDGRNAGGRFWKLSPTQGLDIYFLEHHDYYNREGIYTELGQDYTDNLLRFANSSRAALELARQLDFCPDIIHANDWQTAPAIVYLEAIYKNDPVFANARTLFTIHNLAYQGYFDRRLLSAIGLGSEVFHMDGMEFYGDINLMKGGIIYADKINTVSKQYAKEIQTPEFGCGLEGVLDFRKKDISGILNGVDYSEWNPENSNFIEANYSARSLTGKIACKEALQREFGLRTDPDVPLLGMVSRLCDQKGIDLVAEMLPRLLEKSEAQLVLLGSGDTHYQNLLTKLHGQHQDAFALRLGYSNELAHRIEAGADIFLMPSRHEPCGLNQMYSLRYGTIPVVRKTGGLADTIQNYSPSKKTGNGFTFTKPSATELLKAVHRALKVFADKKAWKELMIAAMKEDFSWEHAVEEYENLYQRMLRSGKRPGKGS